MPSISPFSLNQRNGTRGATTGTTTTKSPSRARPVVLVVAAVAFVTAITLASHLSRVVWRDRERSTAWMASSEAQLLRSEERAGAEAPQSMAVTESLETVARPLHASEAEVSVLPAGTGSSTEKRRPRRVPDIVTSRGGWGEGGGANATATTTIKQISLLGERNTGTTWITAHLRECFNDTIPVVVHLVRHKHSFQHDVLEKMRVRDTLVVAEFRNPCYWVEAMQRKEYLTPMHYKVKDWYTFVTTPWTMPTRMQYDLDLVEEHRKANGGVANYSAIQCQDNFTYNQINSCLAKPYLEGEKFVQRAKRRKERKKHKQHGDERDDFSGQEPYYELMDDGSGRAYSTILDMRAAKIRNFLRIAEWDWVAAVLPVQYDELVSLGTETLIRNVEKVTGLKATCTPSPPQKRTPKKLPKDFVEWMTRYGVDWDTEALIGYDKC